MDEMTLTLNNPLTEEDWEFIEDADFDKTNSIEFHTKHGKTVKFVKCTDERTGDLISRQAAAQPQDIAREIATIIENEKDMRVIAKNAQPMQVGWICPVCGRGLSPLTMVCPCNNGKGW